MFVVMLIVDICYIDSGYLLVCWQWWDHWMFVMLTESLDVVMLVVDICYIDSGCLLVCWQWWDHWMFVMLTVTGCCYVDSRYLLY